MKKFIALVKKDIQLEVKSLDSIIIFSLFVILFSVVISNSVSSAFLSPKQVRKIFPGLLWANFLLVVMVTLERTFDSEYRERAIEAIILSRVSGALVFLSKALRTYFLLIIGFFINSLVLGVMLDVSIVSFLPELSLVALLALIGISFLATLISGITVKSKVAGVLFPVVMVPLLLPMFFASSELTTSIMLNSASREVWLNSCLLITVADLIYLLVGALCFDKMVLG